MKKKLMIFLILIIIVNGLLKFTLFSQYNNDYVKLAIILVINSLIAFFTLKEKSTNKLEKL